MSLSVKIIRVGARNSPLSRAQVEEVKAELKALGLSIHLEPVWIETTGDKDLLTSLRTLDKTDFFTREIDQRQLAGEFPLSIHSAKDLADPLPHGLKIAALTRGVDPSDVIVLRPHDTIENLPKGARIGTSSLRREKNIFELRSDLQCVDIRGTIHKRLELLDQKAIDGVVMAEAALIRLNLTCLNRVVLPGETTPLQGRLAIVVREADDELIQLFASLDPHARSVAR